MTQWVVLDGKVKSWGVIASHKTYSCKYHSNSPSYAAAWRMQTRIDFTFCLITLILVLHIRYSTVFECLPSNNACTTDGRASRT